MSDHPTDLDAYFARIGYSGATRPTLETLNGIVHCHVQAIPFENLDILLGRPIDLDPAALEKKLIVDRRGGYCFEQNGLLLLVLEALGFHARPLSARVRYQRPRDFIPPRTHVFIRVELEGTSWLADVGVGAFSLTSAIRLDSTEEQATPHEPRRIVREGARLFHQVRLAEAWHDICEFTLEEMPFIDRELGSWFTSTHPQSQFKSRLVAARAIVDGGRMTILNREFTLRRRGGVETRLLTTPEELLSVLASDFGLEFTEGTTFSCPALDWPMA
ncbi:MAG TPA: arylamine N-acetyltransferase [Polyangiaceae bacterium]|nr:arylamine N-acetyltransferase [Polyangiaceae bacterium]